MRPMKQGYIRGLTLGVFFLLLAGVPASGWAAETVAWPQLAAYLENNNIPLRRLPLTDCPLALDEEHGHRRVVQVIAHTLYAWREYELNDAEGALRLALIMERPENRRLTAAEARVLLTASARWRTESLRAARTNDQADRLLLQAVNRLPAAPAPRTAGRTSDGSQTLVEVPDAQLHPFRTIALLEYYQGDGWYRGNGVLVGPRCLLTSGNNLCYSEPSPPVWTSELEIMPAAIPDYEAETLNFPFGSQHSEALRL
ncbi:MAG: hypothetical protein JXR89_10045, partial [Deltaproteobacteria bacterium]|nr:hypothetical protein [Deltaproteobacteria bacterium]